MIGFKTCFIAMFLGAAFCALPRPLPAADASGAAPAGDMVRIFAACVGRLSAEMQHQWLLSDPRADTTEAERATMIALLEAAMPATAGPGVLQERLAARLAHAGLLTRAHSTSDPRLAEWSRRRAASEIGFCRGLALF